jgi:hypothetical protein
MARPLLYRFYVESLGPLGGGDFGHEVSPVFATSAAEAVEQQREQLQPWRLSGARVLSKAEELAPELVCETGEDGTSSIKRIDDLCPTEKQRVLAVLAVQSGLLARAA